jgi:hypothetical protein
MYSSLIGRSRHRPTQRIDLLHQMAFANTPN